MPTDERLQGSWMDFQHQNPFDGNHWNDATRAFTAAQWAGKVAEMAALGLEYVVIMSAALDNKSFYPSAWMPNWNLACEDPIRAVLESARAHGLKVFVSAGFYGHTTEETSDASDYLEWHQRLTTELRDRYKAYSSFYGWYVPNEAAIQGHFSSSYMAFMEEFAPFLKTLDPSKKVLIAPYGTNMVAEDDRYVSQLRGLGAAGVDFIAYQDEVGVRKTEVEQLVGIYSRLRSLHDRAAEGSAKAPALWADMEVFEFEGETYASPLIPTSLDRIRRQLANLAPYVDTILCYQTHGLLNPPDSAQFCGHPDSARLWNEYMSWIEGAPKGP